MNGTRKTGKIKGVLFLCFLAFLAVSFMAPALASENPLSQLDHSTISTENTTAINDHYYMVQTLPNGITLTKDHSYDFSFYVVNSNIPTNLKGLLLCVGGCGYPPGSGYINLPNSYTYSNNLLVLHFNNLNGFFSETTKTIYSIILQWKYQSDTHAYGSATDKVAGLALWAPPPVSDPAVADWFYLIEDKTAPQAFVDFLRPMPDQTLADFSDWQVEYLLPVKWDGYYHLVLSYAPVGLFPYYFDETWTAGGEIDLHQFPKTNLLTNGEWQAKIGVWVGEEMIVESELIYFTIFNEYEGGTEPPPPPPIITCGELDFVCQLTKWLTDSFNKLISYLFIPSGASINKFSTLWAPVEKKPPIGYFVLIRDRLAELGEGTAGFTLAGTSGLTAVLSPLKTGIGFCLWLLFAFWLFKRISNLEL